MNFVRVEKKKKEKKGFDFKFIRNCALFTLLRSNNLLHHWLKIIKTRFNLSNICALFNSCINEQGSVIYTTKAYFKCFICIRFNPNNQVLILVRKVILADHNDKNIILPVFQ